MSLNHDKNSVVSPGRPGARLFPDSPLGEDVDGIPSGREVEWVPLVDYRRNGVSERLFLFLKSAPKSNKSITADKSPFLAA